ncbi:uncharacterized protein [Lepeophtheirus salmonis]|uniref:uncharacterized protein isoform X2 n=1 Tax=Lepeophtheirus salmonis TaxID=72036 RepID=UPI003AF3FC92
MTANKIMSGTMFRAKIRERKRNSKIKQKDSLGSKNPFLRFLTNYAGVSTTHGIHYIFEPEGSIFTRILWAIIVITSIVLSAIMSKDAYQAWQDDPILTTVATTGLPIRKIRFPAITICNQGNIKDVTEKVINMRFETYLRDVRNTSIASIQQYKIEYFRDYLKHYLNSTDIYLRDVIRLMKSINPEATARSTIATKELDPCSMKEIKQYHDSNQNITNTTYIDNNSYDDDDLCPRGFSFVKNLSVCVFLTPTIDIKEQYNYWCSYFGGSTFQIKTQEDLSILQYIARLSNYSSRIESVFFVDAGTSEFEIKTLKDLISQGQQFLINDDFEMGKCLTVRMGYSGEIIFNSVDCTDTYPMICVKYISICSKKDEEDDLVPVERLLSPTASQKIEKYQGFIRSTIDDFFETLDKNKSYTELFELLWFDKLPCYEITLTDASFLRKCWWKNRPVPCAALFQPIPTDGGICCSFNLEKAEDMFKKSIFSEKLASLHEKERKMSKFSPKLPSYWDERGEPYPSDGKQDGLTVILDANTYLTDTSTVTSDETGFYAYIDGGGQFPILSRRSIPIAAGRNNYVSLSAIDIVTDDQVREIPTEKRNCYFSYERKLKYFKHYSRNNCLFECHLLHARKHASCTPWYYPMLSNEVEICGPWKANQFLRASKNVTENDCDCQPDCITTIYSSSVATLPFRECNLRNLDLSYFCTFQINDLPDPQIFGSEIIIRQYGNVELNKLVNNKYKSQFRSDDIKYKLGTSKLDILYSRKQFYNSFESDIAVVNFYFDTSAVLQYSRRKKLTTIEFMGQIGGLLGLCIGFSIISFIELIYWFVYKVFIKFSSKNK